MSIMDKSRFWGATAGERAASYPCHGYAEEPFQTFLRAVNIEADSDTVFRWLCQLKVAPYSYDWVDNPGRTSPRTLTPGLEHLEVGQRFLIARIVEFDRGTHITGVSTPWASRIYGRITLTYQVTATNSGASRLVACMTVAASGRLSRLRRALLGWGDLVMMRKQLLTLKHLAESTRSRDQTR